MNTNFLNHLIKKEKVPKLSLQYLKIVRFFTQISVQT